MKTPAKDGVGQDAAVQAGGCFPRLPGGQAAQTLADGKFGSRAWVQMGQPGHGLAEGDKLRLILQAVGAILFRRRADRPVPATLVPGNLD